MAKKKVIHVGDGVKLSFEFLLPFSSFDDVLIFIATSGGADVQKTRTTDYIITPITSSGRVVGGTVTFYGAPTNVQFVKIMHDDNFFNRFIGVGAGAIAQTILSKLQQIPSLDDYLNRIPPTATYNNSWFLDTYQNFKNDAGGAFRFFSAIPNTVNMAGGGNVQNVGLFLDSSTSAQTPAGSISESDGMRIHHRINSDAGNNYLYCGINAFIEASHETAGGIVAGGTEHTPFLGTTRITGPMGGGQAAGAWGGEVHAEKYAGVADGKMIGLEVGIHKVPPKGLAKCNGIEVWSGDRSGAVGTTRAGDALLAFGQAGWYNFIKCLDIDSAFEIFKIDRDGNSGFRNPRGNLNAIFESTYAGGDGIITLKGKSAGGAVVSGYLNASNVGNVQFGSTTNHDVVVFQNNNEALRFHKDFAFCSRAGVEATGAGVPLLGSNCPAGNVAPSTWIKVRKSGGGVGYIPVY